MKSTQPFEPFEPVPSSTNNVYVLTVVDEFSRFPFAFPCNDTSTETIKKCLLQLFSLFGMLNYTHIDRGSSSISNELHNDLLSSDVATSRSAPYNPRENEQVKRYNGTIWKTVNLALSSQNLNDKQWELVLPDALHSIRT